ncbi:MAG: prepilin-type N-terminal cleavage/methylation domain-containing protein [Gammaproteobacteria bacterium]|nr:prepilin-type N-terminal cleavage/methylation domain-containing protein [Gammaproteobacteria bacterium]
MRRQTGFTMIELVMVIVILGILAAVALPKFVNVSGEARAAATKGVAGGLASSSAVNFSASLAKGQVQGKAFASASAITGITDTTGGCTNTVAGNLVDGVTFAASGAGTYSVSGSAGTYASIGDTRTCTLTNNDDTSVTATFVLAATK